MSNLGPGVYAEDGRWVASITHPNGMIYTIGEDYPTREAAKAAYQAAYLKFYPPGPPPPPIDPAKHHDLSAASLTAPKPTSTL